jgi:hypothetical protein
MTYGSAIGVRHYFRALWPLEFSNVLRKALTGKKLDPARAQEIYVSRPNCGNGV